VHRRRPDRLVEETLRDLLFIRTACDIHDQPFLAETARPSELLAATVVLANDHLARGSGQNGGYGLATERRAVPRVHPRADDQRLGRTPQGDAEFGEPS
jgi:hypothetical protein